MTRVDARARERVDERERAGDRPDASVEPELAEHADAVEHAGRQPSSAPVERERDRELEARRRSCARRPARGSR